MNILTVHNYYRIPGGEDTVVSNETELLKSHGHKVISYNRDNSEYSDLRGAAKLKKLTLPFVTIFNTRTYKEIKKIISSEKIDVVFVHNTLNLISPAVYYAAVKCGVPVFQTIHNYRLLCPGATFYRDGHICEDCVTKGLGCAYRHKCYRQSRVQTLACIMLLKIHRLTGIYSKINYICLTQFGREKLLMLRSLGVKIDEKKVYVKPNFMTENTNSAENTKSAVDEPYFIYAGRLDSLKGTDFLVRVWKEDMPRLVVCGTGPLEDIFTGADAKIGTNIEYRGFADHNTVMQLVAGAKALILPTRWYEAFPMSIVEAYSVGTPVIASNIGNTGILVEEGITGYTFRTDDEQSLYEAVSKIADELTHNNLRESTLKTFGEKYTGEKNYEMLMSIIADVSGKDV